MSLGVFVINSFQFVFIFSVVCVWRSKLQEFIHKFTTKCRKRGKRIHKTSTQCTVREFQAVMKWLTGCPSLGICTTACFDGVTLICLSHNFNLSRFAIAKITSIQFTSTINITIIVCNEINETCFLSLINLTHIRAFVQQVVNNSNQKDDGD